MSLSQQNDYGQNIVCLCIMLISTPDISLEPAIPFVDHNCKIFYQKKLGNIDYRNNAADPIDLNGSTTAMIRYSRSKSTCRLKTWSRFGNVVGERQRVKRLLRPVQLVLDAIIRQARNWLRRVGELATLPERAPARPLSVIHRAVCKR